MWSPHAAPFPLFPRASKTRLHESTCHLVSPLFWGIEDEAVWSPHTASFPPFPGALKMRWCGAHMPPCFPSSLGHRRRGGMEPTLHLVSLLHHGIEDEAAWSPHAASFLPFTMALRMRQHRTHMPPCFFSFLQHQSCLSSFHIFLPVFRITIFSLMADSCSIKYIIVLPYHEYYW